MFEHQKNYWSFNYFQYKKNNLQVPWGQPSKHLCGPIWWWWIVFAGKLTYKQLAALFPEKTIARKPHQCGFPTHLGRNQTQMAESAIHNATTTPIALVLDNFWSFGQCGVSHYCHLCNWAQEKSPTEYVNWLL